MKYVKILGLLAVAAASLMAFAGSASATVTFPTGTPYNGELHATSIDAELTGGLQIECNHSSARGNVENGKTTGNLTSLTFTECNRSVTVLKPGDITVHSGGTVTSTGAEVTVVANFIFFKVHCIYKTDKTDIGNLTDTYDTGSTAVFHIDAIIPVSETDSSCGESAEWHGTYEITTPDKLYID